MHPYRSLIRIVARLWAIGGLYLFSASETLSQCALCKSSLAAKEQAGHPLGNLNLGILLMLTTPYLALLVIIWAWRRHAKTS